MYVVHCTIYIARMRIYLKVEQNLTVIQKIRFRKNAQLYSSWFSFIHAKIYFQTLRFILPKMADIITVEAKSSSSSKQVGNFKEKLSNEEIIVNLQKIKKERDDEIKKLESEVSIMRNDRTGTGCSDFDAIESLEREISEKGRVVEFYRKEKRKLLQVQKGKKGKSMEDKLHLMKIGGLKKVLKQYGQRTTHRFWIDK